MTDHPTFSGGRSLTNDERAFLSKEFGYPLNQRQRVSLIILAVMGMILLALSLTYLLPADLWSDVSH